MPRPVDTLIHARWVVPVEPTCEALQHHSIALHEGRIAALAPTAESRNRFSPALELELPQHVLIPGLINAHTHAAMTLFRGMANDLPLKEWLDHHIWPAEQRWISAEFVRAGTELAMAEMLRGGTTCFNDMYFHPNIVAHCAQAIGIRANVGLIVIDFPTPWAASAEDCLRKGIEIHDEVRDWELVSTAFAPHAPYSVADKPLRKIRVLADELGIPVHIHVHETQQEIEESLQRHRVRPLERLSDLGLMNDRLIGVHMTTLLTAEIDALARNGVHVVHCPESNLKLASGLCPVAVLEAAGVNVALGTDGAASNNDLDMWSEMRAAALLAKGTSHDPTALPAARMLEMATLNGARALRLDHEVGSLRIGKAADLIAVDLGHCATQPVFDPVTQLVYSAGRDQVSDVWVAGKRVVAAGELQTVKPQMLFRRAQQWADDIKKQDELTTLIT